MSPTDPVSQTADTAASAEDELLPENVERIIAATIEVIGADGVQKARLRDISNAAGVSIGTIQYYFKTRDNLIDRALYRYTMDSVEYLRNSFSRDDDPWDAVAKVLRAHHQRDDGELKARIWITLVHASSLNLRHLRMLNTISDEWRKLYRDLIHRGVHSGRFDPSADIDDIVEMIAGLTDAFAVGQVSAVLDYTDRMERVTELFLDMLRTTLRVTA